MDALWITVWLSTVVTHAPSLLAILAICIVLLVRREQLSSAFPWALSGFGLMLVIGLVAPSMQVLVQHWAMIHYASVKQVGWVFTVLSLFWSCLNALAVSFVALATFAGRREEKPPTF